MAPAKNTKSTEPSPWSWALEVQPEEVMTMHIYKAYRIVGFQICSDSRRTCKRNPYCLWGLGERKWRDENEGDDDEDPVAFRCEGEYAGLQNLGATCYVNSLLQLWFHNPIFRPAILKWRPPSTDSEEELSNYKPDCPLSQLQAIFARLKISKRSKIDPSDFVSSLLLNTGDQQDAQEFAKLFMEYILNKLLPDYGDESIKKLIAQSANGQLQYETECLGCKNKTRRPEAFTELNLSVKKNLTESLDELLADEIINEYMCSNCSKKNTAKRRMQLLTLPPILNLQILRFVYDREAQRRKKVTQNISFPEVLDLQQNVHRENSSTPVDPSKYKYHLTAVLIHNGQSASSGHYVAQIKDLRNGEWLKFNDEIVDQVNRAKYQKLKEKDEESDDGEKRSKPKKSKNSPSLSSAGAYMLVYTSEECIKNPEPDPELHSYLVDLVRREDASFEREINKSKNERDFEQAVKHQRRMEVEWLYEFGSSNATNGNGKAELDSENLDEPKAKIARLDLDADLNGGREKKRSKSSSNGGGPCASAKGDSEPINDSNHCNGASLDFPKLLERKKSYEIEECDFVCVDWISQWLDPINPVPPIDNAGLLCKHNKLAPPPPSVTPCLYRIVPSPIASAWFQHYNGGPRLRKEDLCELCVQIQCRKLRALAELDEDYKQVCEQVKKCDADIAQYAKNGETIPESFLADKRWITKENWRSWKRIAKEKIEGPSQVMALKKDNEKFDSDDAEEDTEDVSGETFNANILCGHGSLSPDDSLRKYIPMEAWDTICKYFKDAFTLEVVGSEDCCYCKDRDFANSMAVQYNKENATFQKTALSDLYSGRNRPDINKLGEIYIVSAEFVSEWRRFVKDPSRNDMVEEVNNQSLICEHEKFMYPIKYVTEFLSVDDSADEIIHLITPDEWSYISKTFQCDIEIKATVLKLNTDDGVVYEPDICTSCAESWLDGALKKQYEYDDCPIYVIKREKGEAVESDEDEPPKESPIITGKREVKPHNPDAWMASFANPIRRSQRPRHLKGEKTYKVKSSMTVKALKSKICTDFKALLSDQHLFYRDIELMNLTATLQDYMIPARAKLYLEIDTAENGNEEEPVSSVETGFQGTLLIGGSGFGDTRSPVQNV